MRSTEHLLLQPVLFQSNLRPILLLVSIVHCKHNIEIAGTCPTCIILRNFKYILALAEKKDMDIFSLVEAQIYSDACISNNKIISLF